MSGGSVVEVSLQVNGDQGMPQGYLGSVHFDTDGIELESKYLDHGPVFRRVNKHRIRVGRKTFHVFSYGTWVGNWHWDSAIMSRSEAKRLIDHLIVWGFHVMAWTEGSDLLTMSSEIEGQRA
jgi:hypothetical protein